MQLRSVPVSLTMRRFSPLPADLSGIKCLGCDVALDWHQPNAMLPDRLLGICLKCGNWHMLDIVAETADSVFVLLPDGRVLEPDLIASRSTSV